MGFSARRSLDLGGESAAFDSGRSLLDERPGKTARCVSILEAYFLLGGYVKGKPNHPFWASIGSERHKWGVLK